MNSRVVVSDKLMVTFVAFDCRSYQSFCQSVRGHEVNNKCDDLAWLILFDFIVALEPGNLSFYVHKLV
jgi:hypothetical protein